MPEELNDPLLVTFVGGTMLLSLATGFYLLSRLASGPLLTYEPRRPVPWNAFGAVLAVVMVTMTLLAAATTGEPADAQALDETKVEQLEKKEPSHSAGQLISSMLPEMILVGGVLFFIAHFFHATPRDFGLPNNSHTFAGDVRIGLIAGLAAMAPVHVIQVVLMKLFVGPNEESGHPLVKMMISDAPDWSVMVLASVAAVIVAPICEEIIFRLLLQGWLEKWEDQRLGWRGEEVAAENEHETTDVGHVDGEGADVVTTNDVSPDMVIIAAESPRENITLATPPSHGSAALPYGSVPIIASSVLFGIAHFGYGPEPIPLFFLALVLGYVYQRTHRIVPCIVAHAVFNSFTMILLWWMAVFGAN